MVKGKRRTAATLVALALLGVAGFGYRYLGLRGFPDDHFVHLVRSQQVVLGDWPVRDFTDAGAIATVLLSAAAMAPVSADDRLWAEALLTCAGFGSAAVLIALVARQLGAPWILAALASGLAILARPRTYAHPKLWVYAAVVLVFGWYATRPSTGRRLALAVAVVLAFLIRYDHGLYAATAVAFGLGATHAAQGLRTVWAPVSRFVVMGLLAVAPYLLFLEMHAPGGLLGHVTLAREVAREEETRTRMAWPRTVPSALDLVGLGGSAPTLPVNVRWAAGTGDRERAELERAFGLTSPRPLGPFTYNYVLENATAARQAAIRWHPGVVDTAGIDRSLRPGWAGALTRQNAAVVLYYVHFLLVVIALGIGVARAAAGERTAGAWIAMAVAAGLSGRGFLRDPLPERIADVFGTLPVLAAGILAPVIRVGSSWRIAARIGAIAGATVLVGATALIGQPDEHLEWRQLISRPTAVWTRTRQITAELRDWPWSRQWPAGDGHVPLVRYIRACTAPNDRLLVTWHAPHLTFIGQRRFAGTESVLMPAVRDPAAIESRLAEHIARQAPPVALVSRSNWDEFVGEYPRLADILTTSYVLVGTVTEGGPPAVDVRVHRDWQAGSVDPSTGWPCRPHEAPGSSQ